MTGKKTDPGPIEKARHRLEARHGEQGREVARESDRRHPLSAEMRPRRSCVAVNTGGTTALFVPDVQRLLFAQIAKEV